MGQKGGFYLLISDLLPEKQILTGAHAADKNDALQQAVRLLRSEKVLSSEEQFLAQVLRREAEGSTGAGGGLAIPHGRCSAVLRPALAAMTIPDGVEYASMDGQPVRLLFLIAAPEQDNGVYLSVLSTLARLLMNRDLQQKLILAADAREFRQALLEAEQTPAGSKNAPETAEDAKTGSRRYRLLAVTACPTGIAHTYMAAQALENMAEELQLSLKVETQGAEGVRNCLTPAEIAQAECIIIAADRNIPMDRFNGRPVIQVSTSYAIHHSRELLLRAVDGGGMLQETTRPQITDLLLKNDPDGGPIHGESLPRRWYRYLMNGVSHMLPFVIGGGIIISLSFLADTLLAPGDSLFTLGQNSSAGDFLRTVGLQSFRLMLPVLSGYIAVSIGDRPALMVGFLGGALASAGGSGFLGALLAGYLGGYLVQLLRRLFAPLPKSVEGIRSMLFYPLLGTLIIGFAVMFFINPPLAALNVLATSALENISATGGMLLGAALASLMALDMGGPVNKAVYLFGTASLLSPSGDLLPSAIMAAIMAGGMVPPLAIALCATFFPNRFRPRERQSALTNYILGLSFVTEGALPFAATDPLRVFPSCVAGAAVAGAWTMAFRCRLPAPHGGIFVLPVMEKPLMFLAALLVGSVIGMLLMAFLKPSVQSND